jgi:hypothetical protein
MAALPASRSFRLRLLAVVVGVLVALIGTLLTTGMFGIDVTVPEGPGGGEVALTAPRAALVAAIGALVGLVAARVIERRAARPQRTWIVVTAVALALSFIPSVLVSDDASSLTVLIALHVAVAAAVIPLVAATLSAARDRAAVSQLQPAA